MAKDISSVSKEEVCAKLAEVEKNSAPIAAWKDKPPAAVSITPERLAELEDAERIAWAFRHLDLRRRGGVMMNNKHWTMRDNIHGGFHGINVDDITEADRALIDAARREAGATEERTKQ